MTHATGAFVTSFARLLPAVLLAGCAVATTPLGAPVGAPLLVVGDHWHYRVTDGLRRGAVSELDAEVAAVKGGVATLRVVYVDATGREERVKELDAAGGLRAGSLAREAPRRFSPPVELMAFPLEQGKTWRQTIDTLRSDLGIPDQILVYGNVQGRAAVTVPAGTFDAVNVFRILQLDDQEFWRSRTTRRDALWYATEVKAPVREVREAEYIEKGGRTDSAVVRTEYTTTELVSFQPGHG